MNKLKNILSLCILLSITTIGIARDSNLSSRKGENSFGLGLGLPYGAIGARFGTNIADQLTLFGGLGYHLSGVGYNVGLMKSFPSKSLTQFYVAGMYGTNAAIKVKGLSEADKVYTGPTFGVGVKVNSRRTEGNFWDFGLLVPIKSSDYMDDEDAVRNDSRISDFNSPSPVLIVVGYNFNL